MSRTDPEGPPVALVTGANRGIGLEVCRQVARQGYSVLLGSRDAAKGERAARELVQDGQTVRSCQLDVTDLLSIERARARVAADCGRLDVLVTNAAMPYDSRQRASNADLAQVRQALETNPLGAWNMVRAFLLLLRQSRHARVVSISSEAGSLAGMGAGTPAYSLSKVALNALTRSSRPS